MFTGEHNQKVDTKGRSIVPAKFREQLGSKVVITRGLDGCLFVFEEEEFEKFAEKLTSLPIGKTDARDFNRFFLAGATDALEPDKLGRILIPGLLRAYASLESEAIWAGVGNHIEIWNKDKYNEKMFGYLGGEDAEAKVEELAERMAELGI